MSSATVPASGSHRSGALYTRAPFLVALGWCLLIPSAARPQSFKPKDLAPAPQRNQSAPESLQARTQQLNQVFHDYWEDTLKHSPEMASSIGDKRYDDQLSDYSANAYNDSLARGEGFIERLGTIDTTGMSDQEKLSKRLLVYDLVDQQEGAVCEPWQTPVTQFYGIQVDLPMLAEMLIFTSSDDYDHYVARLNKVPAAMLQISTDMMLGEQSGRTEPQYIMQKVLAQVNALASAKPEDTPFASPLQHFPASISAADRAQIRTAVLTAIRTKVQPAYAHFAKYLATQYIPHARTQPGIWANTDGNTCYAHLVDSFTTTELTPDQVYQIGLADVARIEPQLLAVVHQLGYKDLRSLHESLVNNPKEHAQSGAQLMSLYQHYVSQMETKLPGLVTRLPKTSLKVVPMPAYGSADQVPADYQPGTPDGSRPGEIRVNTTDASKRLLTQVEAIAYHEGVPGHHLQISLAQELTGLPDFRRFESYDAFIEGWAFYSEQLGKEVGFYQDPYSEYGMLENQMWRAVRLVVDTGVHSRHWTRDQMVQYFHDHTAMDDITIQEEVDRYIAWPGQALAYDIGRLKILELRAKAQTALGKNFDLRKFHDEVLDSGALPMDILEQRVDAWIQQQQQKYAGQTKAQTASSKTTEGN
ncbi:MAG: DUF885 family protein [Terriglobia bacterium]|nr:DUF885 family protein [Terriglobia bacterium]